MNLNEDKCLKGLHTILNNLNLINLPSSLWGIHIHPKYEYVAIIHVNFAANTLEIDKGVIVQYESLGDKIEASIILHCKTVKIPHINTVISTINDLCELIYTVHELKICPNWLPDEPDKNKNCLITISSGYDKCVMCNTDDNQKNIAYGFSENDNKWKENASKLSQMDSSETIWQTESLSDNLIASSEDVDVVVKQILELEYTDHTNEQMKNEINIPATNLQSDSEADGSNLRCRTCSKDFSSLSNLIRHERTHLKDSKKQFQCSVCNKCYATSEALANHTLVHSGRNVHRCTVCGKAFTNPSHLKVHHRKHSGERPFACDYCGKRFFTKSHLKEHVRLHTGERPYTCPVCNKTNSHQSAHQRHVLTHSNIKPNLCNICGKTFCKGYRMEDHLATHTTERPYECELCQKRFAKPSSLNVHRKTHTGARPHICTVCGKRYSTQSNLGTHMKSHTGVKPYGCGACSARFVHPRLLRLHQRVHTGEKPYSCPDCGRAFAKNVHLTVHRRVHTGERPYTCPESSCGRTFTTSGNMNAHRRVHHSNHVSVSNSSVPEQSRAST